MMEPRIKWGITAIILLSLLFLFSRFSTAKEENQNKEEALIAFSKEAQKYANLKKRWDQPHLGEKLLQNLKDIQPPAESFTQNKRLLIRYKALEGNALNKISHAILASDATIIKLTIKREDKAATLELEVEQ